MTAGRVIAWALPASFLLPMSAHAGGVITHGDVDPDRDLVIEHCDRSCQEVELLVDEIFNGRDATLSSLADSRGLEGTLDLLNQPGRFDIDDPREGGCAASGASVFAALGAALLLRRRRRTHSGTQVSS